MANSNGVLTVDGAGPQTQVKGDTLISIGGDFNGGGVVLVKYINGAGIVTTVTDMEGSPLAFYQPMVALVSFPKNAAAFVELRGVDPEADPPTAITWCFDDAEG